MRFAVERVPGKVSGAWPFKGTRVPVKALFENLESGGDPKGSACYMLTSRGRAPRRRWPPLHVDRDRRATQLHKIVLAERCFHRSKIGGEELPDFVVGNVAV